MTRACFLAEAEWPRLFHKFGFRTPPEPMLRRGFLFPTPSKLQSWKQRRFIFEFQVVKTRIPSIPKKGRVVCSPGSQLSVVKRADPSHKWLPHGRSKTANRARTVEASSRRTSRRGFGRLLVTRERLCAARAVPFLKVPRHSTCRTVVKRSDTSLLTTVSRVRIPPGPSLRACSSAVEHVLQGPQGCAAFQV